MTNLARCVSAVAGVPRRIAVHSLILFAGLCGCGSTAPDRGGQGVSELSILAGAGLTDTIDAQPVQALVVRLLRDGRPDSGVAVMFEAAPTSSTTPGMVSVFPLNPARVGGSSVVEATDAEGRAMVRIALGFQSGTATVAVRAPARNVEATASYVVLPGTATQLDLGRDTVILTGDTMTRRAIVMDRRGNIRSDPVEYGASDNLAPIDSRGHASAGSTYGRGYIRARSGSLNDSIYVGVLPRHTLLVIEALGNVSRISTASISGSNRRRLADLPGTAARPSLSPDGRTLVVQQEGGILHVVDSTGPIHRAAFAGVSYALHGVYASSGQTLYFAARATDTSATSLWRLRAGESAPVRILAEQGPRFLGDISELAVAPDESKMIFRFHDGLMLLDLTSGAVSSFASTGSSAAFPAFSPDGRQVAWYGPQLLVSAVDGSNRRRVSTLAGYTTYTWGAGLSWCPDSTCLITRGPDRLMLVRISDREVLPILGTEGLFEPVVIGTAVAGSASALRR